MRKILVLMLLIFLSVPLRLCADKWSVESLPMVHLQDANRYVCNPDGVLSQAATDSIDLTLKSLEHDTGIQSVVVAVKQLEGDDPYRFGMDLGRKYGIGDKERRTGLIVILATEDRSYQILTGNGLEGALPDAICRRIENRVMVPHLKREEWDSAMVRTIAAISNYVRGDGSLLDGAANDEEEDEGALIAFIFFVLGFGGLFGISLWKNRAPRCPACKKGRMKLVSAGLVTIAGTRTRKRRTLRRCNHCGHEDTTYEDDDLTHGGSGMFPPVITGSRFGGGTFPMGGSFGGGTFGGGGSGGRF